MPCALPLNFQACWKVLGQGKPMPCALPLNLQACQKVMDGGSQCLVHCPILKLNFFKNEKYGGSQCLVHCPLIFKLARKF